MAASRCGSNQAQSLTSGTLQWSHRRDNTLSHGAERLGRQDSIAGGNSRCRRETLKAPIGNTNAANYRAYNGRAMRRIIVWLVGMVVGAGVAPAELLTSFRPSAMQTDYGVASEVEFSTGLVELESGALAHHLPQAMKEFRFAENVWLIAYKTDILDARGES